MNPRAEFSISNISNIKGTHTKAMCVLAPALLNPRLLVPTAIRQGD
jgi:hypothetical protein